MLKKNLFKSSRSKFANQKTKFLMYCVCLCVMSLKNKSASEYKSCVVLWLYWFFWAYSEHTFFPLHNIALFMQLQWQPINSGRWDMGLWKSVLRNTTAVRKGWTMVNSSRVESRAVIYGKLDVWKIQTGQKAQMIPSLTQWEKDTPKWLTNPCPMWVFKSLIWSLCNYCHLETRTHTGQDRNTEWKYKQPLNEQRESLCKHRAISTELCPLLWSLREAKWPVWAVMMKNC